MAIESIEQPKSHQKPLEKNIIFTLVKENTSRSSKYQPYTLTSNRIILILNRKAEGGAQHPSRCQ